MRHVAPALAFGFALAVPAVAPAEEQTIGLHAANYYQGGGECGGTNTVDIRIEPNPTGSIQIGVFEFERRLVRRHVALLRLNGGIRGDHAAR